MQSYHSSYVWAVVDLAPGEPKKWNVATLRNISLETESLRWRHSTFIEYPEGNPRKDPTHPPTTIALRACDFYEGSYVINNAGKNIFRNDPMADSMLQWTRCAVVVGFRFSVHTVLARIRKRESDSTQTHSRGWYWTEKSHFVSTQVVRKVHTVTAIFPVSPKSGMSPL